jgi:hypothetical protein
MPWTIPIDPDANCAFGKYYGAFDFGQLRKSAEEIYNHPHYQIAMNTLRDLRDQNLPSDLSFRSLYLTKLKIF